MRWIDRGMGFNFADEEDKKVCQIMKLTVDIGQFRWYIR